MTSLEGFQPIIPSDSSSSLGRSESTFSLGSTSSDALSPTSPTVLEGDTFKREEIFSILSEEIDTSSLSKEDLDFIQSYKEEFAKMINELWGLNQPDEVIPIEVPVLQNIPETRPPDSPDIRIDSPDSSISASSRAGKAGEKYFNELLKGLPKEDRKRAVDHMIKGLTHDAEVNVAKILHQIIGHEHLEDLVENFESVLEYKEIAKDYFVHTDKEGVTTTIRYKNGQWIAEVDHGDGHKVFQHEEFDELAKAVDTHRLHKSISNLNLHQGATGVKAREASNELALGLVHIGDWLEVFATDSAASSGLGIAGGLLGTLVAAVQVRSGARLWKHYEHLKANALILEQRGERAELKKIQDQLKALRRSALGLCCIGSANFATNAFIISNASVHIAALTGVLTTGLAATGIGVGAVLLLKGIQGVTTNTLDVVKSCKKKTELEGLYKKAEQLLVDAEKQLPEIAAIMKEQASLIKEFVLFQKRRVNVKLTMSSIGIGTQSLLIGAGVAGIVTAATGGIGGAAFAGLAGGAAGVAGIVLVANKVEKHLYQKQQDKLNHTDPYHSNKGILLRIHDFIEEESKPGFQGKKVISDMMEQIWHLKPEAALHLLEPMAAEYKEHIKSVTGST